MKFPKTMQSLVITTAFAINVPAAFSAGPPAFVGAPPGAAQDIDHAVVGDIGGRDVAAQVMGDGITALTLPSAASNSALQASDTGAAMAIDALIRSDQSGNAQGITQVSAPPSQGAHGAEVSAMARDLAATARSSGGDYKDAIRDAARELSDLARQAPGQTDHFVMTAPTPPAAVGPAHGGMSEDAARLEELARSLGLEARNDPGAAPDGISSDARALVEEAKKLSAAAKKKPAVPAGEDSDDEQTSN